MMDEKEKKGRQQIESAMKVLKEKGIRIYAGSCGCCDSPWLKVEVDGEVILDVDGINLDMFGEG